MRLLPWLFWVLSNLARVSTLRIGLGRVRDTPALPGLPKGGVLTRSAGTSWIGTRTRIVGPGALSLSDRDVKGRALPAAPWDRSTRAVPGAVRLRTDLVPPGAGPRGSVLLARAFVDC
jgi:hypothetical protein